MSAGTTRLNLTKPGGGSTGLILPPEPVDIDVINANMDKIDSSIGAPTYTSVTRPASPFDGQIIRESDTQRLAVYRQATTSWDYDGIYATVGRGSRTVYYTPDLAGLDAITTALDGDFAVVENPGTGITQDLRFIAISGSGSGIDWRIEDTVVADTKVNLDAFITAVAALVGTDVQFKVGGIAYVTGTRVFYRFSTVAGAVKPMGGTVPVVPTGAVGCVIGVDGVVVPNAGVTSFSFDYASADFDDYIFEFGLPHTAGGNLQLDLRNGGVDDATSLWQQEIETSSAAVKAVAPLANQPTLVIDNAASLFSSGRMTIRSPLPVGTTRVQAEFGADTSATALTTVISTAKHTGAAAWSGATFVTNASSFAAGGYVRVRGINNN